MPDFSRSRKLDRWRMRWGAKLPTEDWLMCAYRHPLLGNLHLVVGGSFQSYK